MLICQHGTTWVWCPTPWFSLSCHKLCILHSYLAPNITLGFILVFVSHSSLYQLKPYFLYLLVGTTKKMNLWFCGPGKEHALVISNHRSDIDWLVGWIMAQVSPSLSCLSLPLHEFASWLLANIMTESSCCSWKWHWNSDKAFCMFFALSFEQIAMYLCTPAIGTRWSQWGGMAASFCHFVMPVIVWYIVSDRSNGYDNTHSCCFGLTRTYTASVWLSYMFCASFSLQSHRYFSWDN